MSFWRRIGLGALDRLEPRDRRALRIGLAVIVPAAVVVLGVRPYRAALADVQERLATERQALERELELIRSADRLPRAIREAETASKAADLRLLEARSVVLAEAALTDLLESVALRSRVLLREIESIAPARGEEPPPAALTLRLAVEGESDLEGVMTFLDGIESSLLLIRIRGLALEPVLSRPDGEGGQQREPEPTGVVEFQLILESYVKDDAADAAA